MKMRKLLLPLAALSAISLAACGNTGGGSSDNSVRVVFWHTFGDKIESGVQDMINRFVKAVKDNEGVSVKVDFEHYGSYTDTRAIVGTALEAGNGPSMCIAYPDSVAYLIHKEAYKGQYVRRVDSYFNDSEIGFGKERYLGDGPVGDFIQSYIEEGSKFQDNGTFVMPFMKSSEIMIYNKDIVGPLMEIYHPELTGDAVWEFVENMSWDDLINLGQLALDNKDALSLSAMEEPIFYDSDSNMFITQLEQLGLGYSHLDGQNKVVLDLDKEANPSNYNAALDMLNEYRNWHKPSSGQDYGILTTKKTEGTYASDSFKNRKCVFTIGSSGGAGYTFPSTSGMDYGICRVPYRGNDAANPKYISQGPSVCFLNNKGYSKEKNDLIFKYSWKLYKYLTNTTNNTVLCVNNSEGYVPVRESCYDSEIWAEFIDGGQSYAEAAQVVKDVIRGNFISSLVFNGSASYRDYVGGLIGDVMKTNDSIATLLDTCVNNTKNDMNAD